MKASGVLGLVLLLSGCARQYRTETPADLQFQAQQAQAILDQDCYNHQTSFTTNQERDAANTQNAMCSLNKALAIRKLRAIYGMSYAPPVVRSQPQAPVRQQHTVCTPRMVYPPSVPGQPQQPPYSVGQDCVTQ